MYNRNAQGNYNQGRGQDGLGFASLGSRFGTGVQTANRPASVGGRRNFDVDRELASSPTGFARSGVIPPGKGPAGIYVGAFSQPGVTFRARRPGRVQKIRDRRQFVNWIKRWSPALYADAKAKADLIEKSEATLGGLGSWWDTFTESLTSLGGKYVQFKTQKEILDAQMERMRQGLPPLQTSEYAPTVAVKPDAGTTREITGAIGAGISSLLPWLLAGGVGLFLLLKK